MTSIKLHEYLAQHDWNNTHTIWEYTQPAHHGELPLGTRIQINNDLGIWEGNTGTIIAYSYQDNEVWYFIQPDWIILTNYQYVLIHPSKFEVIP